MSFTHACYLVVALSAATIGLTHAQERTAGSAMDTQMTWTALSNLANAASNKADAVNTRVDQIVVCARKGMLYAPGGGADAQGCVDAAGGDVNTRIETVENSVTNLITNMQACSAAGQIYNGATCAMPKLAFRTISSPNCGPAPKGGLAKCQNNDATAERVCKINNMSGVSAYAVGSETNPGPNTNNFNATWNGSAFVPVSAYHYKYFMSSVSCYNFTFE